MLRCFFLLLPSLLLAQCPLKDYPVSDHSAPVLIVGGGLTGLISAYELKKAKIASIVIEEKRESVGG